MNLTDEQIFENEISCITRRNEGICNGGTDCVKCDLLMDSEEIIKCYNRAIARITLINQLKAKNKRLHEVINGFEEQSHKELLLLCEVSENYENAKAEIERLTAENLQMVASIKGLENRIRKEFAEKLKEQAALGDYPWDDERVYLFQIDNLLAEMNDNTITKVEHSSLCETETYKTE